jgi:imidazolonepropionase-like amidohydrolase
VKTRWGTDIIGPRGAFFELFPTEWEIRKEYYTPFEQLQQVTKFNGEMVAMSGPKNPYPEGPLGVIEEGAYADILLVNGNPLKDILILRDYKENIHLIMKDGKGYKSEL